MTRVAPLKTDISSQDLNVKDGLDIEGRPHGAASPDGAVASDLLSLTEFLGTLQVEIESASDLFGANPYLAMATHLVRMHVQARLVTASSLVAASGAPYATGMRKLREMQSAGLIERRPRTRTGKSYSLHPAPALLEHFDRLAERVRRLSAETFGAAEHDTPEDYYFGQSYLIGKRIVMPSALPEPLALPGGLRGLVHGDPTFMVMKDLKRQFEQLFGCEIHQRAFSIDRLRAEALRNAQRRTSRYDIIAVDLPWIGEFAEKGVLEPLDTLMEIDRLDPGDFHTAGWQAVHWKGRPYGVPSQTTPELLFYRTDIFAEAGLTPPATTESVLDCARYFSNPRRGRYGIAWNAARGTALGHTFIMTCADFGLPIVDMPEIAGGFDATRLHEGRLRPLFDRPEAVAAAEYLCELMDYSPPNILSMSWYERVRPYAQGIVPMAYGYTLLAPYFDTDRHSPAYGNTGYLPHPSGPQGRPVAPVGGYALGIPTNIAEDRRQAAVEALVAFTSPGAQKLYVLNGSRTSPRYSVGADPELRQLSPIFEAVDGMSWRDELQFWPRPPIPQISSIFEICGEEIHDMLRGLVGPRDALKKVQNRAEQVLRDTGK